MSLGKVLWEICVQDQPGGLVWSAGGGWALLRLLEKDPKSHINNHAWLLLKMVCY